MSSTVKAVTVAGFAARVLISPPATSLFESAAVVAHLQLYGRVIAFNKGPASDPERQEMEVIYSSAKQMLAACKDSPIKIKANHQLPDARIQDPYNVRGLQHRKHPASKTLLCKIKPKAHHAYTGQTLISQPFQPSYVGDLHESLLDSNAPMSLVDALGASPSGKDHLPLEDPLHPEKTHRDLMAAYRTAVQQNTKSLEESQSQSAPQPEKAKSDSSRTSSTLV